MSSFSAFCAFFNKKLGDLYKNGDHGAQEQTNQAAEVNDELRELCEGQANLTNELDTLKEKYGEACAALASKKNNDAVDASTGTKTTKVSKLTTDSLNAFLKKGINEAIAAERARERESKCTTSGCRYKFRR